MIRWLSFIFLLSMTGRVFAESDTLSVFAPQNSTVELPIAATSASDTLHLDEVVLEKESVLEIPSFKSVYINKVIAKEGAKIRLVHQSSGGDSAGENSATDGAHAKFFFNLIDGHLLIESRGGDGVDGINGRNGRQGKNGKDGRRAKTLFFGLAYIGDGEDGSPGEVGEDAEDGTNGSGGGNGGNVYVYFLNKTDRSDVIVDVSGGKGGRGGRGGLGGLGGNGGRGGFGISIGKQGAMGRNGKNGVTGSSGRPGLPGKASVYQVDNELFRCLFQLEARSMVEDLSSEDFDSCRKHATEEGSKNLPAFEIQSTLQSAVAFENPEDGSVVVSAMGEKGEDAQMIWGNGASPADGMPGAAGGNVTLVFRELPSRVIILASGGEGGHGASGTPGKRGIDGEDGKDAYPLTKGAAGTDGQDGGAGGNGSNGGDGGNGGHVRVVLISDEPINSHLWADKFDVDVHGGISGEAGMAGLGGRGGKGGIGGATNLRGKYFKNGKNGRPGMNGKDGKQGAIGSLGRIEFFNASSMNDWIVEEFENDYEQIFRRK